MREIKNLFVVLFLFLSITGSAKEYKASLFGIRSDGLTLNTKSIQKAIDFISENGGGKLVFYVGRYLTGTIQLKSKVSIELTEGAVLVGTTSVYDYFDRNGSKGLITGNDQDSISITGKGVIEGQGPALLDQINGQIQKGYLQETVAHACPGLILFDNCSNITVGELNLLNACGNVIQFSGCKSLHVNGITVKSTAVNGSKGVVLNGCDAVTLTNTFFETSGKELESDGKSKKVIVSGCKNSVGMKITANK